MRSPYELALVIPTLNEAQNVSVLLNKLRDALQGISWEVIFVDDDSDDGTADVVWRLSNDHPNVRCLKRIGRRGLASASIEGMLATAAPYIAVMDADLQHDETLLQQMLHKLQTEPLDIVIASRFAEGAALVSFSSARERLSRIGNALSRMVSKADLTDPLSGFFMLRRQVLAEVVRSLSGKGFKILLDIFASARRPLRYAEFPLTFRERHSGESKLDTLVALEFLMLLADKTLGRFLPVRFVLFILVGAFGILVHLAALGLGYRALGMAFTDAQIIATVIAIAVNFSFNNRFTYRDQRLKGLGFIRGLLSFYAACLLGATINFQVAKSLFDSGAPWPMAGALSAVVGSVWNYAITSTLTWTGAKPAAAAASPETSREAVRALPLK